ncbi:helix-turn-helix domain-containing protein [Pseudoalteromonas sp. T1lg10]|uniref:helix-turn-helix domain-containing protein n=1 Tax=Pseudoalteromonas sp. T1lg10 TaxID=2077093 RepID=UPI000CF72121|nr:helix-turn-helix domain-containing protein [Pseudoalteromonas sp. T1lg10]
MNATEIKQALIKKGYSLSIVASVLGVSLAHVSSVVNRHTTSNRIAAAIAKVIEKDVNEVFPDVDAYKNRGQARIDREQKCQELQQLLHGH